MTIFVYVSRTLKLRGRPKPRLSGVPAAPSNLSWKRPPRGRGRPVKVLPFLRRMARTRYQPLPPPVSVISYRRPPPLRIKRMRLRVRRGLFPFLPLAPLLARPLRRLRIRRGKLRIRPRLYSISGPPASFILFKKPPRPKIKKARWSLRAFARRFYVIPANPITTAVAEWIIRARRRGRR